jgi:aryl-alcohol dehydrogenase-like predicted oxidoreductase
VPIPDTKRRPYLEENMAAAAVTLTQAELEQIAKALPLGIAAGDRYPDMSSLNR